MTENQLIEALYKVKDTDRTIKVYRHSENVTGVYMAPNQPILYNVDVEAYFYAFQKHVENNHLDYELVSTRRQVKERELGNSDEAYETTYWKDGKVVGEV